MTESKIDDGPMGGADANDADCRGWRGRRGPKGLRVLKFVLFGAIAVTAVGFVVMGLWNALVPAILAGPAITWAQGLGLFALSRILFGGWGGGRHRHHDGGHWRGRWQRKMEGLSPEERERMKAMMTRGRGPMRGRDAATGAA